MLKVQQIFQKLYECLLYVVFHNLESQNAGLVDVKKDLNLKDQRPILVRKNLKNTHCFKNVIGSEDTFQGVLAIIFSRYFSNSFTFYQTEEIKKGVICAKILLEIHRTEHS